MVLKILIPETYIPERQYIIDTIISCYLGLNYKLEIGGTGDVCITLENDVSGRKIHLADYLFNSKEKNLLKEKSLPVQPLERWNAINSSFEEGLTSNSLPIIYGRCPGDQLLSVKNNENLFLDLDIFGSAFFMLTRYEELIKPDRDKHGRFPASASLAYQEGFLDRPIIDEYVEILWNCMKYLWPGLERKNRQFQMVLSHDVDAPYRYAFLPFSGIMKTCAGDIAKRKNLSMALNRYENWRVVRKGSLEKDPNNRFDLIMDKSELYNLKSVFFFQASGAAGGAGNYYIHHPLIKSLIKQIAVRGHEIGLHPGFNSFYNPEQVKKDTALLKGICNSIGVEQATWGGRQHYLQWKVPHTWQSYEDAGLDYDSSLSYADHVGFRCGTCREYPVFNLLTRCKLNLVEKPLIVMEGSLLNEDYMGLPHNAAFGEITKLIDRCKKYAGNFTLLWHNSSLVSEEDRELYLKTLEYGCR